MNRPSIDLYFMRMASVASTLATCPRKSVGAVIVRNKRIVATGYNGSIGGQPHCEDAGCMMEDGHCIRTIHSEANAILQAARTGMNIEGCAIYVTASPCFNCFKLIANSGLVAIYFGEFYREKRIHDYAEKAGIALIEDCAHAFFGRFSKSGSEFCLVAAMNSPQCGQTLSLSFTMPFGRAASSHGDAVTGASGTS